MSWKIGSIFGDSNQHVVRRISSINAAISTEEPVVALNGLRSVDKSTVLRTFADSRGVPVVDLDDPVVLDAVRANPTGAIGEHKPRGFWMR